MAVFGQFEPLGILKEYQMKSDQALSRINTTLETQGAVAAANLVNLGDTEGADEVSKQIKVKIAGNIVSKPHSAVIKLFRQYDSAREAALNPIQSSYIAK